jgi:hypothetical protein
LRVSLGVVVDAFETACTWDRFEALHAQVVAAVRDAMKRVCGRGFLSCWFRRPILELRRRSGSPGEAPASAARARAPSRKRLVQVLLSSLRDMRPQGLGAAFGVCFYQVSYRAAVRYRSVDGSSRRGGFFIRTDTNHQLVRAIGNALAEFKFHHFGAADVMMLREGERLTIGVDPRPEFPGGKIFGVIETSGMAEPPPGSVWRSLEDLHLPLVECYDALGVDHEQGFLHVLTIDRDPWNPRFVNAERLYCEYFDTGSLGGAGRLDSILHFHECCYRWRPLRREPLTRVRAQIPPPPSSTKSWARWRSIDSIAARCCAYSLARISSQRATMF